MAKLGKDELLGKVLDGLRDGGWSPLILNSSKPFQIRAVDPEGQVHALRVYIWNCTHGGGGRAGDEYRIQFTGSMPRTHAAEVTLLMGWHDEIGVFAAWDIAAHDGQAGSSPSAQVKLATLEAAHAKSFATQPKDNEIVVAFRSAFIGDYARSAASLHRTGKAQVDFKLLNRLDAVTDEEIAHVDSEERRTVIRTIARRYRAANFRERVMGAYRRKCAFCGVQLSLLDAAHIIPVFAPDSTDNTNNGIALCKLHHFAYDSNLVSFNESFTIEVSSNRVHELNRRNEIGGLPAFREHLFNAVALPEREISWPTEPIVRNSRRVRGWLG